MLQKIGRRIGGSNMPEVNEGQMSLEDYGVELGPVEILDEDINNNVIEADLNDLSKEELIQIIEELRKSNTNYDEQIKNIHDHYSKEMTEMNQYYIGKLTEKGNLVSYYERKFKVLKDIINIETGEVKPNGN